MASQDFAGRKALVVEDQEMFRDAVVFELEDLGFTTKVAKDGQEALGLALAEDFDFILSDIRMPNWDGRRFLDEFRKHARLGPPFAFMTGFADLSVSEAFDMGADAFLGKPINTEKLVAAIRKLLQPPAMRWGKPAERKPDLVVKKKISRWDSPDLWTQIGLGRGGIFLAFDVAESNLKAGDLVGFDVEFSDGPIGLLRGTGTVVWKRSGAAGTAGGIGVEFESVEEPGLSKLIAFLEIARPAAVIPLAKAPAK